MAKVRNGMTPREVVEILGPPLDFADETDPSLGGGVVRAGYRPRGLWWLYADWPKPGVEITLFFTNGQLASHNERRWHPPADEVVWDDWAHEVMVDHVTRMEDEFPDQRLAEQPGWYELTTQEVLDFVIATRADVIAPGHIGRSARGFDDVDVIVSKFEVTDPATIRTYLPHGYLRTLSKLIDGFGITPRKRDLAHWLLGHAPDGGIVAHLAYVPADDDVTTLVPSELLAPGERV
jgi:hypothetical protein